jgi:hypothetical protein
MKEHEYSTEDEINDITMNAPHVVILGAGASVAAFPNGDKNGRVLPTMDNFIKVLGLDTILNKYQIPFEIDENFENLYSRLYVEKIDSKVLVEIENLIREYFSKLELPDTPTIYDYLVLSLRKKDVIATFNWDPFLYKAACRNYKTADMPHLIFLHGAVNVGHCIKHEKMGIIDWVCPICNKKYTESKILYPIEKKNYSSNEFISTEWETIKKYLSRTYIFTLFGYGAPKSDTEAIKLLKEGWDESKIKELLQVEIIDIKPEDKLKETWDQFIFADHCDVWNDFYKSWIAKHPRRTCDAMWAQLMMVKFTEENPVPKDVSLEKLQNWYKSLVEVERKDKK